MAWAIRSDAYWLHQSTNADLGVDDSMWSIDFGERKVFENKDEAIGVLRRLKSTPIAKLVRIELVDAELTRPN